MKDRHIIIGTAGHIDHGKTCLVKALTGVDTDRLEEEKRRGITIESGFAPFALPDGTLAGIVDVPGHEKFIRNMVSGAAGMDMVMLVIAADEGIMPQTREHMEILTLLGIRYGLVVLTKTDLCSNEMIQHRIQEIIAFTKNTFLQGAPVIPTSIRDGEGISELKTALVSIAQNVQKTKNSRMADAFRMLVDRVFTLKGFGTIVTGTMAAGCLHQEDTAMLYPSKRPVKIRSIQVHDAGVREACAGQRTAVNINGISKDEISRGEILAAPGSLKPTMMADVWLHMIKGTERSVRNGSRVHLYHGAKELVCKVILMDRDLLLPGEECFAQLRLEDTTALVAGEHFVIRFYSPVETVGGGVILDPDPKKHKRNRPEVLQELDKKYKELQNPSQKDQKSGDRLKKTEEGTSEEYSAEFQALFHEITDLYIEKGFYPPETAEVKERYRGNQLFSRVFFHMVRKQYLYHLDEKHYIHKTGYEKAIHAAMDLDREKGRIATGEFRDILEISRKNAIALLEQFDKDGLTVRKENVRKIRYEK